MADRIVYLVNKVTASLQKSELKFVDHTTLGELLDQGWETSTTLPNHEVVVAGKKFRVTMMVLKLAAENRGVSVRQDDEHHGSGRNIVAVDQFGMPRSVTAAQGMMNVLDKLSRALSRSGDAGHLGSAQDHSLPGINIISGEMVSKAFDVGVNASQLGQSADSCPFPPSSVPGQRWLQGFRTAERSAGKAVEPMALNSARNAGIVAAREFGQDDVVECPFPTGSPLRNAWIEGFRSAGGRVE